MADHQEALANFMAITGADDAVAMQMLEASDWNLEQAIELHFSTQGDAPQNAAAPSHDADEALARQLAAESGAQGEVEVRAPMPTVTERLYGDDAMFMPRRVSRPPAQQHHQVDAFADFRGEGLQPGQGQPQPSGSVGQPGSGLADLFKPPPDLLYVADFEVAKHKAAKDGRWLLVNVQSHEEFASHQLNRDTWSNSVVKDLLLGQFIFWQVYNNSDDGQKITNYYQLFEYPAILILDPITGAKIFHKTGFVEPEKFLEDLVPFMDHGPQDAGAVMLAQTSLKRRHAQASGSGGASGSGAASASGSGAAAPVAMSEDEELARAIAMSMQEGGAEGRAPTGGRMEPQGEEEEEDNMEEDLPELAPEPVPTGPSAEEMRQEALQRLPPEPAAGQPTCRVAVRCPDGNRMQRNFSPQDTVQAIVDFCIVEVKEAAEGRVFQLVPTYPGAVPVTDTKQTLQQAGVANAMLAMKWSD